MGSTTLLDDTVLLDSLDALVNQALDARQEEEFVSSVASTLRTWVQCDIVTLVLSPSYIRIHANATSEGVTVRMGATDLDMEPLARIDPKGVFYADVRLDRAGFPWDPHLESGALVSAFVLPFTGEEEFSGYLLFGWSTPIDLSPERLARLRQFGRYITSVLRVFGGQRANEIDALTGLLNRLGLARRWQVCQRSTSGTLLFCDLDRFELVNDLCGRAIGNSVLRQTANLLQQAQCGRSLLARSGGDEFILVCPGLGWDEAQLLRRELKRAFKRRIAALGVPRATVSIGLARWPEDGFELEGLVKRARERLYAERGKHFVVYGTPSGNGQVDRTNLGPISCVTDYTLTQQSLAFALAEVAELHDGGSRGHLWRIREFTRLLVEAAAEDGHPMLQVRSYRRAIIDAAILHDVGKMAVPASLLMKPDRLSHEEFDLVKTHTVAGERILLGPMGAANSGDIQSLFLRVAANIARSHHEWWDGSGYPDGLAGEEIPLEARIVAIADVYDAVRSSRPYKDGWSHEEAITHISEKAGTHFDPELAEVFVRLGPKLVDVWERMKSEVTV